MTVWMDKTGNGWDCLRTNSEEAGAAHRMRSLPVDCILVRMSDGAVTIAEPTSLPALSLAQCEMVEHFLAEKGMANPHVFAGQPVRTAPSADITNEKEIAT